MEVLNLDSYRHSAATEMIPPAAARALRALLPVSLVDKIARFQGGLAKLIEKHDCGDYSRSGTGCVLCALKEITAEYHRSELFRGERLTSPSAAADFLRSMLRGRQREAFCCLFLTTKHAPIAFEELFHGTLDGAAVHPREVVRRCLQHNAGAVILAHNHPAGDPTPSAADRSITIRLRDALGLIDVRVLDHFIVGDQRPKSMAEMGYL